MCPGARPLEIVETSSVVTGRWIRIGAGEDRGVGFLPDKATTLRMENLQAAGRQIIAGGVGKIETEIGHAGPAHYHLINHALRGLGKRQDLGAFKLRHFIGQGVGIRLRRLAGQNSGKQPEKSQSYQDIDHRITALGPNIVRIQLNSPV